MENINWVVWLLAAAGGTIVGMIVLAIGMWAEARKARLTDRSEREEPMSERAAKVYLAHPPVQRTSEENDRA
jgi:uncharacterized iron-regulated membrane protein